MNKKKRVRVWTPEDRAAHRLFEKSRREAFNDAMIELARQIPALAKTRRLNKHMIAHHSVVRHKSQRRMCLNAAQTIRHLIAERDTFMTEINQWRSAGGVTLLHATPITPPLQGLLNVECETFGSFPKGFGDNGTGEDNDDDEAAEYPNAESWMAPELQSFQNFQSNNLAAQAAVDYSGHHETNALDATHLPPQEPGLESSMPNSTTATTSGASMSLIGREPYNNSATNSSALALQGHSVTSSDLPQAAFDPLHTADNALSLDWNHNMQADFDMNPEHGLDNLTVFPTDTIHQSFHPSDYETNPMNFANPMQDYVFPV